MNATENGSDLGLLRSYTRDSAESAFTELVQRHLDLVYSAALRQVRSPQLAEEVAQSVFADLARNSATLKPDTILTAWLYQVTHRTAIDVVRRESRRQLREQIATEMNAINATEASWTHIEPLLDEAMSALDETDRAAILLRYFENKSLREVGATLGTSDDAAQKRVGRAVERLREYLAKRGIPVGASGLVVVISANAVQAAPVGFAVTISTVAALAGTTLATTATATATKAIAMTTLQKTVITAVFTAAVGAGIYEAHQASQLRAQVQTLQQRQTPLADQIQKLQLEREASSHQLAALRDENSRLNSNASELIKLRNEIGQLRRERASENKSTSSWQVSSARDKLQARNSDARYLPKADLANVGYATPLKALQTITWAMMNGNYDQVSAGLSPELLEKELENPNNREQFEKGQRAAAQSFKGIQIVAQKNLSLEKVELKVRYDAEPPNQTQTELPDFMIQPMVKVGNEWKLGGNTRGYTEIWEQEGQVFEYIP